MAKTRTLAARYKLNKFEHIWGHSPVQKGRLRVGPGIEERGTRARTVYRELLPSPMNRTTDGQTRLKTLPDW